MNAPYLHPFSVQRTCNKHLLGSRKFKGWHVFHIFILLPNGQFRVRFLWYLWTMPLLRSTGYRMWIVKKGNLMFLKSCAYIRLPMSSSQMNMIWTDKRMQLVHVSIQTACCNYVDCYSRYYWLHPNLVNMQILAIYVTYEKIYCLFHCNMAAYLNNRYVIHSMHVAGLLLTQKRTIHAPLLGTYMLDVYYYSQIMIKLTVCLS